MGIIGSWLLLDWSGGLLFVHRHGWHGWYWSWDWLIDLSGRRRLRLLCCRSGHGGDWLRR